MKYNDDSIILISKDAMCKDYLPIYGNRNWVTPNISELADKGTVFSRYYTAAPSSAMAYWSMFTGKYAHEALQKNYTPVNSYSGDTLFDKANKLGFETHVIWDEKWMTTAKLYSECYGRATTMHPLKDIRQPVGAHFIHSDVLLPDVSKSNYAICKIEECIAKITSTGAKVFCWMHLPHVINGRTGYGMDIDLFDEIVGIVRKYFCDKNIFITSDHGNMNGFHDKIAYGFDVNESAINIPLITPRLLGEKEISTVISSVDLYDIVFNRNVPKRKFIYSDSAYYAQRHRKLAIISERYKYIYSKRNKEEELYDLIEDPGENKNLMYDMKYDVDRHLNTPLRDVLYYPFWGEIDDVRKEFREQKSIIWKNEDFFEYCEAVIQENGKILKRKINKIVSKFKK